ncbi:Methyltransferase domain-containing protein [Enhydrobacter aerosaccus]|uniref:Methyltransferase domain-containing protein n=1 Tax=Enhydrobacter aerosaccus TaxID=225324 RepID=A0A1T4TFZ2_9HYPH|nr:methyltransferase domain-containing protein [Enhydrobacter aerosaccus]SKA39370.1 Methyltransferase domain-containing protein [Enhydrobacter aerosaccus]
MAAARHLRLVGAPSLSLDSDELARDYERISATRQFQAGQKLAADLAIQPGERVLDLGCGTGLLAEHVADLVGPTGEVVGIDPLPLRIELAHSKRRDNLRFEVGDAYDLDDLANGTFDVVIMNAVFHWLPEKTKPLLECARLLRPGGRIGISTMLKGHRTHVHQIASKVLAEPPFNQFPRPRAQLAFPVDAEEMRAFFGMTGFVPSRIEVLETTRTWPSAEAVIRYSEASTFGNFLGHLPPELKNRAHIAIRQRVQCLMTADGIVDHGRRLVAMAHRH